MRRICNRFLEYIIIFARKTFSPMKRKFFALAAASVALSACRAPLAVADVHTQKNIAITAELEDEPRVSATIEPYRNTMEKQMNERISHTAMDLTKTGDNSNLGALLADYTLESAKRWAKQNGIAEPDAAIINIGGIRSTIGRGEILLRHIYEVMPFENELVLVKIKGKDIGELFHYYETTEKNNPVSQLYIETDSGRLTNYLIRGAAPSPEKTYIIATSDYLALGGDNMDFFGKGEMISTGLKLRDAFVEMFRENPEITAPSDIRLNFKNKKTGR
ncbi:5'-nucleotidase, C-terminal domain [Cruoricaptor ignavus]|uniref:5'-nucleotidase, C-terminal domain n=2 Tax=Cruoricaptor ignavus TaxID=1118202 RepID=A0A1M6D3H7_9FLAO|nr:5'-nucleotidase, C-terminal domain [Cruoricaptor ignavus]